MNRFASCLIPVLSLLIVAGCGGGPSQANGQRPKKYSLPEVPSMIQGDELRKEYLLTHYWDLVDFTDTTSFQKYSEEQFFRDYIVLVNSVDADKSQKVITEFWKEKCPFGTPVSHYFISLFEKYLGNPNSPYRNDSNYIAFLRCMVGYYPADSLDSRRYEDKLTLELKNLPGTMAADLSLLSCNGSTFEQISLHSLKSDYLLLYFNNPGCTDCQRVTSILSGQLAPILNQNGILVVSIYPDDDFEQFREYQLPSEWVKTIDLQQQINLQQLYYLKAIPTLYLLDRDKRVVLRDCTVEQLYRLFVAQSHI